MSFIDAQAASAAIAAAEAMAPTQDDRHQHHPMDVHSDEESIAPHGGVAIAAGSGQAGAKKRPRPPAKKAPAGAGASSAPAAAAGAAAAAAGGEKKPPAKKKRVAGDSTHAHPAGGHPQAPSASSAAAGSSAGAKRVRRPAPNASGVVGEVAAPSAPPAKYLSPALLSILGDPTWTPRFLQTVLGHLGQTRSAQPNWHVVSALFRQKLVEGGWNKQVRFVVKQIPRGRKDTQAAMTAAATGTAAAATASADAEAAGAAASEDGAATAASSAAPTTPVASVAPASSDDHGVKRVLVRSRRVISDFTPPVLERLYSLLTSRDRGPEAAKELQRLFEAHKQMEAVAATTLPYYSGGRPATLPTEDVKLEFTGGLPKGESNLVAPNEQDRPEATTTMADGSVASTTGAPAVVRDPSSLPVPGGDALDYWPGLSVSSTMAEHVIDGASIRRWMKCQQVHQPWPYKEEEDDEKDGRVHHHQQQHPPLSASSLIPLQSSLASLHHLHRRLLSDRSSLAAHKPWVRQGLPVDFALGQWTPPMMPSQAQSLGAKALRTVWSSPEDDANLLEAIRTWLVSQPPPTPDTFLQAAVSNAVALLPRTLLHWMEVRDLCNGRTFSCGFFRRRWWLLLALHDASEEARYNGDSTHAAAAAAAQLQLAPTAAPAGGGVVGSSSVKNPSLDSLFAQVKSIAQEMLHRMMDFREKYGDMPTSRLMKEEARVRLRQEEEAAIKREEEEKSDEQAAAAAAREAATAQSVQSAPTPVPTEPAAVVAGPPEPTCTPPAAAVVVAGEPDRDHAAGPQPMQLDA